MTMQSKDFAIGVLATTAAILVVGLALVQSDSGAVFADGMTTSASAGNYTLGVGNFDQIDEEFVYLIDAASNRMVVYRFDAGRRQIEVVQGIDLVELRGPGTAPGTQPVPRQSPPQRNP